jgi:hypothetical protein
MVSTEMTDPQREKFLLNWMQTRLAHEGMMLNKILRQNRIVEQLAAQTREGKFSGGQTPSDLEGEDMGVSIGNETHNHYEGGPRPIGLLGKLIVAASLLAGGAGAGVLISELLSADLPPAVDTDTATDVAFPD